MKIKGNISILIGAESTRIEIGDSDACTQFLRIDLNPEQISRCLSRQAMVECEITLTGLDNIGKKMENKTYSFEIPEEIYDKRDSEKLRELAQSKLTDGWIADSYFRSQNSFSIIDGKHIARVTIRRWI